MPPQKTSRSEEVIDEAQNNNFNLLEPKQLEIYKGLNDIGPEISAFYLNGIKILRSNNLEIKSYLLAHIAREIESSLRDILTHPREEDEKKYGKDQGHIISIVVALGADRDDTFVKEWYDVASKFSTYAHHHGAMKTPRERTEFDNLWRRFEDILFRLLGTYYNLLDRVDRILRYETPTEEIIQTLPNLLSLDARYSYFFHNLNSAKWLKPLKDEGYFSPEKNPAPQEVLEQPGTYRIPHWSVLHYLENIANRNSEQPSAEITDLLVQIVNSIIDYRDGQGNRIENFRTDWTLVKIIRKLPLDRITNEHIKFIGTSLESRWTTTLIAAEIGKSVLPKLIDNQAKSHILNLLDVILAYKKTTTGTIVEYSSIMEEYWLNDTLEKHKPPIAKLCGIEAAEITLNKMYTITNDDKSQFNNIWIPTIEDHQQSRFQDRYDYELVRFVRDMLESTSPKQIKERIEELLTKDHPIYKRIAIHIINHHYEDLQDVFWNWTTNPLEEISAKHEIYELFRENCPSFSRKQIENVLTWTESKSYRIPDRIKDDNDLIDKILAYEKKEWLSAILESKDPDVAERYEKYQKINPAPLEHPGSVVWSEFHAGSISPIEKGELLDKSNQEISEYLLTYNRVMHN